MAFLNKIKHFPHPYNLILPYLWFTVVRKPSLSLRIRVYMDKEHLSDFRGLLRNSGADCKLKPLGRLLSDLKGERGVRGLE